MHRAAGLVLTGGASRRLGIDKATLLLHGEPLAVRLARVASAVCDPVWEVGPGRCALPAVREDPPGAGPLAAFAAGCAAIGDPRPTVVLAVDLPFVDDALVRWLAEHPAPGAVVPVVDEIPQVLCARYGTDAVEAAPALLAAGERALRGLLAVGAVHLASPEEWGAVATARSFADVDTPDDVVAFGLSMPG